jgi:hypothetical protein
VTTDEYSTWDQTVGVPVRPRTQKSKGRCDRVFSASVWGIKGTVTEHRCGIQANTFLDLDVGAPVRQSWVFPEFDGGAAVLLSLPGASAVQLLKRDLSDEIEEGSRAGMFDTTSRTLAADEATGGVVVQVTEDAVNIIAQSQRYAALCSRNLSRMTQRSQITLTNHSIQLSAQT